VGGPYCPGTSYDPEDTANHVELPVDDYLSIADVTILGELAAIVHQFYFVIIICNSRESVLADVQPVIHCLLNALSNALETAECVHNEVLEVMVRCVWVSINK